MAGKALGIGKARKVSKDQVEQRTAPSTAAPHPEEMKAAVEFRLGDRLTFTATARATPAGLIAAAILLCSIMVPIIWISGGRERPQRSPAR
ncbi:MAG: hypothetical protein J0H19_02795 [Rhodospirillales bacterium]|nr:hypothetical protein [Rhodospirillales bacterium]MBN8906738.1 hypothetical protein [Rhodospirillales bacterium]MBN8925529.1 hypothetical protein [Rhodospirillales bacterium]